MMLSLQSLEIVFRCRCSGLGLVTIPGSVDSEPWDISRGLASNLYHFLLSMKTSLSIFFYRRIYDLDPSLLQTRVAVVQQCLMRCEEGEHEEAEAEATSSDRFHNSAIFVWSAFVAACEAQDLPTRNYFASWFRKAARQSGLHFFLRTLSQIEKAWRDAGETP